MLALLSSIWANDLYRKLILSVLIFVGINLLRRIIIFIIDRKIAEDSPHIYTLNRVIRYTGSVLTVLLIFGVWVERLGDLTIALGILAAGLAFALQEVIGSIAGWLTIISGRPFSVGDRVETGGIRGDVVDIGILRTTIMEIGNWIKGDQNTGRIVTVSNAFIFKEPLFNYSAHLNYIWDEINIPITYESDWRRAITIMLNAVQQEPQYKDLIPRAEEQRRIARQRLAVKINPLEPRVFIKLTDNWIELGIVYPVDIDLRRKFHSDISQCLLSEFTEAGIKIASETMAIVQFPTKDGTIKLH